MEQLKDIRAIELIEVNFLPYFIFFTIIVLFISVLIYFISHKKINLTKREKTIQNLKNINFKNYPHKDLAYIFTIYGRECLQNQYEDKFNEILVQLEHYKYKESTSDIPNNLLTKMKRYIYELV